MVTIIKFILIFVFFFTSYGHSSPKIKIIRDAEIEYFFYKVIRSIVSDLPKKKFYPRLVLNDQYNAFVTGNRKIYINTGLIEKSISLSEIQGILAHEIGHLILNHHSSRLINSRNLSKYSKLATFAGLALATQGKLDTDSSLGLIIGSKDLATKSLLQFSRIQENEADKFALDLLIKKNISLNGLEKLLIKLSNEDLYTRNSLTNYYRTHPFSRQRLEQVKRYKLKQKTVHTLEKQIFINRSKISLEYIKNKIRSYNMEPSVSLKNEVNNDVLLSKYSKVIAFLKTGQYDLAEQNLEMLKRKFQNYPFFSELGGDILYKKGNFKQAIIEYKKAIRDMDKNFSPSIDLIKFSLVKTYLQTNEQKYIKKSVKTLEELVRNNPHWSYLWRLLAKSSGLINKKGVSYIALAEEALIKKNFIKAIKYVDLANRQDNLPHSYKLRGADILAKIKLQKPNLIPK